ncbi:MAG: prenyltransferase/squalene oxidase repeat-containing protein [Desulfobacteraceae bacterium]
MLSCCSHILLKTASARKLADYVLERQKPSGGFGLTPRLPATLEDTYYAVRILEILGQEEVLNQTPLYVSQQEPEISRGVKMVYALLYLRQKFHLPMGKPLLLNMDRIPSLEEAYYWRKIAEILNNSTPPLLRCPNDLHKLSLPPHFIIKDLHYYLELKSGHLTSLELAYWAKWVQACECPDGGFGFKPGTTSFMDNVLPALEIYRIIGDHPANRGKIIDFILSCQTRVGGFARKSGGVAFLESSFQAVKSLRLLGQIPDPKTSLEDINKI